MVNESERKQTWDLYSENLIILLKKSSERLVLRSYRPEIAEKSIEAATHRCSLKKLFVRITKDSQENPTAGASFLSCRLEALGRGSGTGVFL